MRCSNSASSLGAEDENAICETVHISSVADASLCALSAVWRRQTDLQTLLPRGRCQSPHPFARTLAAELIIAHLLDVGHTRHPGVAALFAAPP